MNITQYRIDGDKQTQRTLSLEAAVNAMRKETKSRPVSTMRERLDYRNREERAKAISKVPLMVFSGVFRKAGRK